MFIRVPQLMKKPTIIALFASLLFASFVSATAQETAVVAPIKASVKDSTGAPARPLTEIYRVGVGDVLDIRLLNSATNKSTLFTVIESGVIDLPIAGGTISVAGLTPEEIQNLIGAELKRRRVAGAKRVAAFFFVFVAPRRAPLPHS